MNLRVRKVTWPSDMVAVFDGCGGDRRMSARLQFVQVKVVVHFRTLGSGLPRAASFRNLMPEAASSIFTNTSAPTPAKLRLNFIFQAQMYSQLLLFRRQYGQLVEHDFLAWPPKQLLRDAGAQTWLYRKLFDHERNSRLPPERYQLRVLKSLLAKIEQSIEDPEEDVGIDSLFGCGLER